MSHVSVVKVVVRNVDALEAACADLGLEFVRDQKTYGWYGRSVGDHLAEDDAVRLGVPVDQLGKCEHAIKVPGTEYEIGVAMVNGVGRLLFDSWGPGQKIVEACGPKLEKLSQAYAVRAAQAAMRTLENKGFRPVRVVGTVGEPMQLVYQRG